MYLLASASILLLKRPILDMKPEPINVVQTPSPPSLTPSTPAITDIMIIVFASAVTRCLHL